MDHSPHTPHSGNHNSNRRWTSSGRTDRNATHQRPGERIPQSWEQFSARRGTRPEQQPEQFPRSSTKESILADFLTFATSPISLKGYLQTRLDHVAKEFRNVVERHLSGQSFSHFPEDVIFAEDGPELILSEGESPRPVPKPSIAGPFLRRSSRGNREQIIFSAHYSGKPGQSGIVGSGSAQLVEGEAIVLFSFSHEQGLQGLLRFKDSSEGRQDPFLHKELRILMDQRAYDSMLDYLHNLLEEPHRIELPRGTSGLDVVLGKKGGVHLQPYLAHALTSAAQKGYAELPSVLTASTDEPRTQCATQPNIENIVPVSKDTYDVYIGGNIVRIGFTYAPYHHEAKCEVLRRR